MPLSKKTRVLITVACIVAGALAITGALYAWHEHLKYQPEVVAKGVLYRSRQLPESSLEDLSGCGIKTVLNLRQAKEDPAVIQREEEIVRGQGIDYVFMPMNKIVPSEEQLQKFLQLVRGPGKPVLVHCREGKARTGILVASYRVLYDRWSVDKAMEEMYSYKRTLTPENVKLQGDFLRSVESRRQELMAPTSQPAN